MTDATLENGQEEAGSETKERRRSAAMSAPGMMFAVLLMMLPVAPSTFTVFAVYMAPTILIMCFRNFHLPGAITTVAGMNFAGTMPALYYLWTNGNSFEVAFFVLLFDMQYLGMAMAAAALGFSLLWLSPFIARTWVDLANQHLLNRAEAERARLLDEWGEGLLEDPPPAPAPQGQKE